MDVKDDGALAHAVLDAGVNVAEPVTNEYHQLLSVTDPTAAATIPYRLVGPICTPADVLYQHGGCHRWPRATSWQSWIRAPTSCLRDHVLLSEGSHRRAGRHVRQ